MDARETLNCSGYGLKRVPVWKLEELAEQLDGSFRLRVRPFCTTKPTGRPLPLERIVTFQLRCEFVEPATHNAFPIHDDPAAASDRRLSRVAAWLRGTQPGGEGEGLDVYRERQQHADARDYDKQLAEHESGSS